MPVHAERFTSIERHTPLNDGGRVCEELDCETQLSIYNESTAPNGRESRETLANSTLRQ